MDGECVCCGVIFASTDVARAPLMYGICPACALEIQEASIWLGEEADVEQEPSSP